MKFIRICFSDKVVANDGQQTPRFRLRSNEGRWEMQNQFKAIEKMNEKDKDVIKILIDAFITKGKLKQLAL